MHSEISLRIVLTELYHLGAPMDTCRRAHSSTCLEPHDVLVLVCLGRRSRARYNPIHLKY
jgi:hypothetical protein